MNIEFGIVDNALASLCKALSQPPKNDLERDGVIQRFEYSFELIWKVAKRVLNRAGVPSASPRAVIRHLAQQGFLENAEGWLTFLNARNYTSHTYNEAVAMWVFSQCEPFAQAAEKLLAKLKDELKK